MGDSNNNSESSPNLQEEILATNEGGNLPDPESRPTNSETIQQQDISLETVGLTGQKNSDKSRDSSLDRQTPDTLTKENRLANNETDKQPDSPLQTADLTSQKDSDKSGEISLDRQTPDTLTKENRLANNETDQQQDIPLQTADLTSQEDSDKSGEISLDRQTSDTLSKENILANIETDQQQDIPLQAVDFTSQRNSDKSRESSLNRQTSDTLSKENRLANNETGQQQDILLKTLGLTAQTNLDNSAENIPDLKTTEIDLQGTDKPIQEHDTESNGSLPTLEPTSSQKSNEEDLQEETLATHERGNLIDPETRPANNEASQQQDNPLRTAAGLASRTKSDKNGDSSQDRQTTDRLSTEKIPANNGTSEDQVIPLQTLRITNQKNSDKPTEIIPDLHGLERPRQENGTESSGSVPTLETTSSLGSNPEGNLNRRATNSTSGSRSYEGSYQMFPFAPEVFPYIDEESAPLLPRAVPNRGFCDRVWLSLFLIVVVLSISVGTFLLLWLGRHESENNDFNLIYKKDWTTFEPVLGMKKLKLPVQKLWILEVNASDPSLCDKIYFKDKCVKRVEKKHVLEMNEADILYNFVVDQDGTIYEGRGWKNCTCIGDFSDRDLTIGILVSDQGDAVMKVVPNYLQNFLNVSSNAKKLDPCFHISAQNGKFASSVADILQQNRNLC